MLNPNSRIADLIGRHLNGTISDEEGAELNEWKAANVANRQLFERYSNEEYVCEELKKHYYFDAARGWERLIVQANIPFRRGRLVRFRWVLSAAAVLLLAVSTWLFFMSKPATTTKATPTDLAYKNDIDPGGDRARLTLADGTVIVLDSATNGALALQGGTKVVKNDDGSVQYEVQSKGSEILYNTLSTPKGGQFQIVLADGSKVWLNSLSSIRYPTAFTGSERRVDITGEAFFEIEKNKSKPFRVHITDANGRQGMVEVLATQFNVNAYPNEDAIKTTLLEGKIKLSNSKNDQTIILKPYEQVSISQSSQISQPIPVQTNEVVAWKNGYFHFENKTIEEILRTASRWYDISVQYDYKPSEGYRVKLPRGVPISKMLQYLEMAGGVHFEIDGKAVIVKQ